MTMKPELKYRADPEAFYKDMERRNYNGQLVINGKFRELESARKYHPNKVNTEYDGRR